MDTRKISELLREHRSKAGLTLDQVESKTHISKPFIKAMEADNFDVFDTEIYARNFVRTYARFLRIPEGVIQELMTGEKPKPAGAEEAEETQEDSYESNFELSDSKKRVIGTGLLVAAIGLLIFGVYYFAFVKGEEGPTLKVEVKLNEEKPVEDVVEPGSEVEVEEVSRDPYQVTFRAINEVWFMYESERESKEKLLKPDDLLSATFSESLRIRIGDVDSLQVLIDGKEIEMEGEGVFDKIITVDEDGNFIQTRTPASARERFRAKPEEEEKEEDEEKKTTQGVRFP